LLTNERRARTEDDPSAPPFTALLARDAPGVEAALQPARERSGENPQSREHEDAQEQLVGLQGSASHEDQVPEARRGRVELAHDHAFQATANAQPNPREDDRDGA